jgi:hypothetical protein
MTFFTREPLIQRIVSLSQAEIDAPTTSQIGDYTSIFQLDEAPYTRYVSNGVGFEPLHRETNGVTGLIATGATVTHGLDYTPTVVTVTPADTGVTDHYVSALGATTFVINYSGGGTHAFYWRASY